MRYNITSYSTLTLASKMMLQVLTEAFQRLETLGSGRNWITQSHSVYPDRIYTGNPTSGVRMCDLLLCLLLWVAVSRTQGNFFHPTLI